MKPTVSWKDGGALLPQVFVMMLIATHVLAESPPINTPAPGGSGKFMCNRCDFKEDNYRGPTWAYPCMRGYQGPKTPDITCAIIPEKPDGCFRRISVIGGKQVIGTGGCFDNALKKACIEEVTKVKFNEATGCIPEITIDPIMNKALKEKCHLLHFGEEGTGAAAASPAPVARRRRREVDDVPKGIICVCTGEGCNNAAGGFGRSAEDKEKAAAHTSMPISKGWIGVVSGISLIGGSFLVKKQA